MKYPNIILFRDIKYNEIDEFIKTHENDYNCNFNITDDPNMINKLSNPNYHILITIGNSFDEYRSQIFNKYYCKRFLIRSLHKSVNELKNINEFNKHVNYCYINNVIRNRETTRPVFSLFTPSYKSWGKIMLPYNSILNQTLNDWEWIIMDDSEDEDHFNFLKKLAITDERIRLFKHYRNSGSIGDVKNETIGLCRGKYVLEMDHDDEILPDCLMDAFNVFEKDPEVGFVYMDFVNLFDDGENGKWGDFTSLGYGGYYMEKYNNKWVYVYSTPNINNITLSHIVATPNHPRIWRRESLLKLGSYSEFLPICDDYEILVKTGINCKSVKINKNAYIQYMSKSGNNFSVIRVDEINRLTPYHLRPQLYQDYNVNEIMKAKGGYDDPKYIYEPSVIWKRGKEFVSNYVNERIVVNYDKQYCIIGKSLYNDRIRELYQNPRNDFIVVSNDEDHNKLPQTLENLGYTRMKCYSMKDCNEDELIQYFKLLYKADNCDYEIIIE